MQDEDDKISTPAWNREQIDRFASWEIFRRQILGEASLPMSNMELCDRIGVSPKYPFCLIKTIQRRLNLLT
jgi:hypothetical protein